MKIKYISVLAVLLTLLFIEGAFAETPTPSKGPSQDRYDFRKVRWGMSRAEVRAAETEGVEKKSLFGIKDKFDPDSLFYLLQYQGHDATLLYKFVDGKLQFAVYDVEVGSTHPDQWVKHYYDLKKKLTKEYGKPVRDDVFKRKKNVLVPPEQYGIALMRDLVKLAAKWEKGRTVLFISLFHRNRKPKMIVQFQQKGIQ